jgi:outer membrane protein TolC
MKRRRTPKRSIISLALTAVLGLGAFAEGSSDGALDIARAQELASSKADEVAARKAVAAAALGSLDAARSQLLPRISGSLSSAYLVNPPAGVTVKKGSLATTPIMLPGEDWAVTPDAKSTYFKGNVTFAQPLYAWGKIRAAIDLASLESELASVDARGAGLDAARQANRAYFSALLSRRSAAVLNELRGLAARIVEDRSRVLDEGLSTKESLLSAKADLADLDAKLVEAEEGERSSLEYLAFLTGLDASSITLSSDFRDVLPPIAEEGLKSGAASSSTAFGEARVRLSEARRKLDLEGGSGAFKPDLSVFASLDASGQDIPFSRSSWMDTWSWNLSLGLAAKVDFFDGGAAAARKRAAAAQIEAAEAGLAATLGGLRLEARKAVDAARRSEAALSSARARGDWAAEALKSARALAADEMISRSELSGAEIREASARLTVLGARYALEESLADLDRLGAAK